MIDTRGLIGSKRSGPRRKARKWVALASAATIAASLFVGAPAFATPESEIVTRWAEGTPASSSMGQLVNAEVRINVNDDQPAPGNSTVENFTATFATSQGRFAALPESCLTSGVNPVSSISADGSTIVCNFGTQHEGTALALQVPIEVTGVGGQQLTFDASVRDVSAPQLTHEIVSNFMMDLSISQPSALQTRTGDTRSMQFEYSLSWGRDSEVGPDSVSYVLTATPTTGTLSSISACAPFTNQLPSGHPNSGAGSPPERTAPFADCAITRIGATNQFIMVLSNIDYSLTQVPTESSGDSLLPTDRYAVASGKFVVDVLAADGGSVDLTVNTPTYESVDGNISVDDPSNNIADKAWLNRGLWTSSWNRFYSGSGGGPFDDTYRVAPGTTVRSSTYFDQEAQQLPLTDAQVLALCTILDNKYVDYADAQAVSQPGTAAPADATFRWYVGSTQAALDPDSASYSPGSLNNCGQLSGGSWVTTQPTNLASIQAVRLDIPFGSAKQYLTNQLQVEQTIQMDAPVGMDVWQFSSNFIGGTGWGPADANVGVITPVPDARYTHTNGTRDILRIVGVTPSLEKTVDSTALRPGTPATYTLTYAANGGASAPETVDDYQIIDELPAGLAFVEGSADPAPTVTVVGGAQVLTWELDAVTTNTSHTITYQAVTNEDAVPGQRLENAAHAVVQGRTSAESVATVTITTDGRTIIGKSADQEFIPNVDGNGNGSGSWTVTLRSEDPIVQSFTDVIDILPYIGDGRGTSFNGTYAITGVTATDAETVYYTTADPADVTDDPADPSNGSAGDVTGNTVGWTATAPADLSSVTAVRVIGGDLVPSAVRSFRINIETQGAAAGDVYVNRAQGRAEHTELVMRTSAPTTVSAFYAYDLKKYVLGADEEWHDAQDENEADWPMLPAGSEAQYKFVVTNTGQGDLTEIVVTDPLLNEEWVIDSLPTGESVESKSYAYDLTGIDSDPLRNEACAVAPLPDDATQEELAQPCDEANLRVGGYTVSKTSDPASGTTVAVGDVVTYTVEVTHTGVADVLAAFDDTLTEVLDDAAYNGDVKASAGTASIDGDVLSWHGMLERGDVVTVTYSVTVVKAGDGVLTNVVVPTEPGGMCVPASDKNADCTTTHDKKPVEGGLAVTGLGSVAIPVSLGLGLLLIGGAFLLWKRRREAAEIQ